jgi:hypothetical protein
MTRSLTSKLAEVFHRDYPQLSLVRWRQEDTESLRECFEGCYGVFISLGFVPAAKEPLEEWTRAEIALGERCIEAARVSHLLPAFNPIENLINLQAAGISHLIYPSFPSVSNASNGRIDIRYFETAYQISRQIQSSSVPATILCPGPFYTDFTDLKYAYWEGDAIVLSTPAAPSKRMAWADPGHDTGLFARALLDKWPVCGQSISYSEMASKLAALTGMNAKYLQCSVEEFEARSLLFEEVSKEDLRALGAWLAIAPDDMACYGTVDAARSREVQIALGVKALTWENFLKRRMLRLPTK